MVSWYKKEKGDDYRSDCLMPTLLITVVMILLIIGAIGYVNYF